MSPVLNHGDLIFLEKISNKEIKPGMIIVYDKYIPEEKKIMTIIHRVIGVEGENLKTKGDANSWTDPWQVSISEVKGVYLFRIPYLGYLSFIKEKLQGEK